MSEINNSIYYHKYIKYKTKYINLKGGSKSKPDILELVDKFNPYLDFIDKYSNIIKLLAKGSAVAATIATLGFGGDTSVEFGMVTLDSLLVVKNINDIYSLFLDSDEYYHIIKSLLNVKFTGVEKVNDDFENISKLIEGLETKDKFIKKLCEPFEKLLIKLGSLVGDAISTGIPDDNFVASTIIQELISKSIDKGSSQAFESTINGINKNYKKVPESFQNVLQDPKKMSELLKNVFTVLKKLREFQRIGTFNFGKDPFMIMLDLIIKYRLEISELINKSIALLLIVLNIMKKYCTN